MYLRLHLRFFAFYVTPRVELLSYLTLSKPWQAHHKETYRPTVIDTNTSLVLATSSGLN